LILTRGYPYENKRKSTKTIEFSKGVGTLRKTNENQQTIIDFDKGVALGKSREINKIY
jgi:hypothetical protein